MSEITRNEAIRIIEDIRTAISAGSVTNTMEALVLDYCVKVLGGRIEEASQSGKIENLADVVAFLADISSSAKLHELLDDIYRNPLIGYYECDTPGGTAAKAVSVPGYILPTTGGSLKIKMANRNTVADATLNINSTGAMPLYYNGKRADVGNSWNTNEIIEVFYDGTNYQSYNVAGGYGDGVFDISAYNLTNGQPTPYEDLRAALGTNGANVPEGVRKGGMSVKFIQTSDNRYMQYRYMGTAVTGTPDPFLDTDNWAVCCDNVLVKNPEFIKLFLDNKGHILWAIKKDGDILYGAGVPSQIIEFVEDIIKPFKESFYSTDNPEFTEVKLDALDKILEGYRKNGNKFFNTPVENNAAEVSAESNPEHIKVEIDNNGRIINSIDRKLENAVYGGINLSEIKRDRDIECLEVGYDDKFIYTIENNESSITLEIDDDLNVYEVKDSAVDAELVMEENGDVYLEQIIMEI